MRIRIIYIVMLLPVLGWISCNQPPSDSSGEKTVKKHAPVEVPEFNADSAYRYVARQVAFGPRVPNTPEHDSAAQFLLNTLSSFADSAFIQNFQTRAYNGTIINGKNIIASFKPGQKSRILLCAHWDSRPYADHDPNPALHSSPILGANDGASGVGVLLEIARILKTEKPRIGIDIILFDAEDYGPSQDHQQRGRGNWWALGSQYWASNPHDFDYFARYAILLDMVGSHDATFYLEGYSMTYAPGILKKVWNTAHRIGYKEYFIFEQKGYIDDDHLPINETLKIPAINIIHLDDQSANGSFFDHWHTIHDDLDIISRQTLKIVGQTVLTVIFEEK